MAKVNWKEAVPLGSNFVDSLVSAIHLEDGVKLNRDEFSNHNLVLTWESPTSSGTIDVLGAMIEYELKDGPSDFTAEAESLKTKAGEIDQKFIPKENN